MSRAGPRAVCSAPQAHSSHQRGLPASFRGDRGAPNLLCISPSHRFFPPPLCSDSFPGPFSSAAGAQGERRHGRLHPRLQRRRRGQRQGAPGRPGSGPAAPPELGPARPGVLRPADRPGLSLSLVRQPQLQPQPRRRQQRQQQGLGLHHREPPGSLTAARPPPQPREDASETQPLPSAHVALVQPFKPAERSRGPAEHADLPQNADSFSL